MVVTALRPTSRLAQGWPSEQGLGLSGNGPMRHSKEGLRLSTEAHNNQKLSVKAAIRGSAAQAPENDSAKMEECKWREFFEDPSLWWDNRTNKRNPNYPDFVHTFTGEYLWIDSYFCPKWVPTTLKCLEDSRGMRAQYRKGEAPSFQSAAPSFQSAAPSFQSATPSFQSAAPSFQSADVGNTIQENSPHRSELSFTENITENTDWGGREAIRSYNEMREAGGPSISMVLAALKACTSLKDLQTGMKIHVDLIENGDDSDIFVANTLVDMYAKCGSMVEARRVFDRMPHHSVVSWTAMILGYAQSGEGELALQLYTLMQEEGCAPDARTFVAALKACASLAAKDKGKQVEGKKRCLERGIAIHSQAAKSGNDLDIYVASTLVDMYTKCGSLVEARQVFERMPHHSVVSWTSIILGYAQSGEGELALQLFARMQDEGCAPNARTFVAALKACASLAAKEEGKRASLEKGIAIHSQVAKSGHELNTFVANTLIDMYAKCGSMVDARRIFDRMRHHSVVSWTSMILGYVQSGKGELGLQLYARMQKEGCVPNARTYVAALKACGSLAALETGKKIHLQICSAGLESNAVVANCLVDFYGKCGSMADAQDVFDSMVTRDLVTWSSLIAGYSRQADTKRVFDLFERMQKDRVQANGITFLSILTVCSHAGLVDKGKEYFEVMCSDYGIRPEIDHYVCMADLLGRANQLDDVVAMVKNMPFKPNMVIWMTVLSACRKWTNVAVGRLAFESLLRLDDKHSAAYVLMANIYAAAGMWEESAKIQAMRRNARAWKKPGQSQWTDDAGMVHTFVSGDTSHPQSEDIHAKLKDVSVKMEEEGYVPDLDSVLHNISDDEKESALCGHSEKLAIACALINTAPGTTIRIIKNLRVCDDCHKATAVISKIEQRAIICRDASRFHVFKDGKCSCGDFW